MRAVESCEKKWIFHDWKWLVFWLSVYLSQPSWISMVLHHSLSHLGATLNRPNHACLGSCTVGENGNTWGKLLQKGQEHANSTGLDISLAGCCACCSLAFYQGLGYIPKHQSTARLNKIRHIYALPTHWQQHYIHGEWSLQVIKYPIHIHAELTRCNPPKWLHVPATR